MIGCPIRWLGVEWYAPLEQVNARGVLRPREQQYLTLLEFILAKIEHAQGASHGMRVSEWEPTNTVGEAKTTIKFTSAIKV